MKRGALGTCPRASLSKHAVIRRDGATLQPHRLLLRSGRRGRGLRHRLKCGSSAKSMGRFNELPGNALECLPSRRLRPYSGAMLGIFLGMDSCAHRASSEIREHQLTSRLDSWPGILTASSKTSVKNRFINDLMSLDLTAQEIHHDVCVHANPRFQHLIFHIVFGIVVERDGLIRIDWLQPLLRPLGILAAEK